MSVQTDTAQHNATEQDSTEQYNNAPRANDWKEGTLEQQDINTTEIKVSLAQFDKFIKCDTIIPVGEHSLDAVIHRIWHYYIKQGAVPYTRHTYSLVAHVLNFNNSGRIKDIDGNNAPWITASLVENIIRDT